MQSSKRTQDFDDMHKHGLVILPSGLCSVTRQIDFDVIDTPPPQPTR